MSTASRRRPRGTVECARRAIGSSALVFVVLAVALTGCSQDESPGEQAPAVAAALDRVDAAVEAENFRRARSAVESLAAETRRAQQEGVLSGEDADRIRTAVRAVLANLPVEQVEPAPQDDPTPEADDPDSDEESENDDKDDKAGKDDEKESGDDESEEGGGNGSSSENGPADGHGN